MKRTVVIRAGATLVGEWKTFSLPWPIVAIEIDGKVVIKRQKYQVAETDKTALEWDREIPRLSRVVRGARS